VVARLVPRLEASAETNRLRGCKKLKGVGDYRAVYEIDDTAQTVDVTRIAHRREVYG